ncbi:MAG: tRNA guanosine(34) transglycosylase Tgt [Saprospiraceae bacterium]|nr:tRNA guanosine(34) transglycosylase Tgt [Saprospiraceae bacterium]
MKFTVSHSDPISQARTGTLHTDHGLIETPVFMPVGTQGSVKSLNQHQLLYDIKAQIILGNTYHLYLRPGLEILQNQGGLHQFINWPRPILTDSGGYQVYSLSATRRINDDGVTFSSHIDGSKHFFSPEKAVDIQRIIGADIIMAFDECTPFPCNHKYAQDSLDLTEQWLDRCLKHFKATNPLYGHEQMLVPIVQGSVYHDLRRRAADHIASLDHPVTAIGGLSVGEPAEQLYEITDLVCSLLPKTGGRYLMGVGTPADILNCIDLGIDMFDCVLPTRNARHGLIYTSEGRVNIKNRKWADCADPIDPNSPLELLRSHSKAYLRHLIISKELLGAQLASLQNLSFYEELTAMARQMIKINRFPIWKDEMLRLVTTKL